MKITTKSNLYAVMNSGTLEFVSKYSGGFLWARKGDALNKLAEMTSPAFRRDKTKSDAKYEMVTCTINIVDTISGEDYINQLKTAAAIKQEADRKRNQEINRLKDELKELTGFSDIPTVKTFLVKTLLVPDYKIKIENTIDELSKLNYHR